MKCAVSFLSVVVLVVAVSAAAIYILWLTDDCKSFSNYYVCTEDNHTCIPFSKLCNMKPDCPNGSDEAPHTCADLITLDDFMDQHSTKTYESTPVPEDTCTGEVSCVEKLKKCNCKECTINCKSQEWSVIPWDEFDSRTRSLSLINTFGVHGGFGWKGDTRTDMTNIKSLLIEDHSHSDDFPWELLRQNKGIITLYLQNNGIQALPESIFREMTQLKWLFLQHNNLQEINTLYGCSKLYWLNISSNNLTLANYVFKDLPRLSDLTIAFNRISEIHVDMFRSLKNLKFLYLEGNMISAIHEDAFVENKRLKNLVLANNRLTILEPFTGMLNVTRLNIAMNPFNRISTDPICKMQRLASLNVTGIDLALMDMKIFSCLPMLSYVHFSKFGYCRYAPKVPFCFPSSDGLSSTRDLVEAAPLRLFIWVMAVLTIVGNITVLVSRWGSSRKRGILDVFINNLAVADMLTGIYLVVLAVKDIQFRSSFNQHAFEWTTSWLCSAIGIIAMISCEVSLLILTIMSLERYLVISVPFSAPKLSKTLAHSSMAIIWVFIILLALTPLYQWKGKTTFYGSSDLCFPLHLDESFSVGWEYSAFVFIGLNSCCLILIAISYGKLFYVIRQTRLSTPIFMRDMQMALRFFVMVVADFICWLPIITFKVTVLHGYEIPQSLHPWLLIMILPLNAALNPILYTFSTESVRVKFLQRVLALISRVNNANRNSFENHVFPHVGHTSDTPLCNSILANKRQDHNSKDNGDSSEVSDGRKA